MAEKAMRRDGQRSRWDSAEVRFFKYTKVSDGCWEWHGPHDGVGYGILTVNYRRIGAHRFSYQIHRGQIPQGLYVCHHCDNRNCVNPNHLFVGTSSDNQMDSVKKGRHKHPVFRGEDHGEAKLTWEKVREIRRLYSLDRRVIAKDGHTRGRYTLKEIGDLVGCNPFTANHVARGRSWKESS